MVDQKWKLVLKVPNGHRYFEEVGTGRIAMADNSGGTPDLTDDGILYLDTSRPVAFGQDAQIPLLTPTGDKRSTVDPLDGGLAVVRHFDMAAKPSDPDSYVGRLTADAINAETAQRRADRVKAEEVKMVQALQEVADAANTLYHEAGIVKGIMYTVSPANLMALGEKLNAIGKRRFSVERKD
jgi:hypothetical protein